MYVVYVYYIMVLFFVGYDLRYLKSLWNEEIVDEVKGLVFKKEIEFNVF